MSGLYGTMWLQKVKAILDNCGLSFMWHEQHTIDTIKAKHKIQMRIEDVEIQKWYSSISTSPMCSLYNGFNSEFRFEKYLLFADYKSRVLISKFRCRNIKIPIKTSTYMPVSNLCNLCNNKLIGDEYHYLFFAVRSK